MNIFPVEWDYETGLPCPVRSAQSLGTAHILSQIKESAQMLSATFPSNGELGLDHSHYRRSLAGYKHAYRNHPCTLWVGETLGNFRWLLAHAVALHRERVIRYCYSMITHNSMRVIRWAEENHHLADIKSSSTETTPFALAMPEFIRALYPHCDEVNCYRLYYKFEKIRKKGILQRRYTTTKELLDNLSWERPEVTKFRSDADLRVTAPAWASATPSQTTFFGAGDTGDTCRVSRKIIDRVIQELNDDKEREFQEYRRTRASSRGRT